MDFRSMFKVRKPGNGKAFEDKVKSAGKQSPKVVTKSNEYKKSSVSVK